MSNKPEDQLKVERLKFEKEREAFLAQKAEFERSSHPEISLDKPPAYLKCVKTGRLFGFTKTLASMHGRFVPADADDVSAFNEKFVKAKKAK